MSTIAVTNLKHESATGNNIVLDSSGNAAFADGSASAPSITNDGDTNTGIYFPAADNIGFATNGVIRGRWTTDGLCFGSDTAAANALDDYEEGTWTLTDQSGAGLTFTNNGSSYTKVGRLVTINFEIIFPSTANGSNVAFSLPFTSASGNRAGMPVFTNVAGEINAYINAGSTISLYNDTGTLVTNSTMSTKYIICSISYFV